MAWTFVCVAVFVNFLFTLYLPTNPYVHGLHVIHVHMDYIYAYIYSLNIKTIV